MRAAAARLEHLAGCRADDRARMRSGVREDAEQSLGSPESMSFSLFPVLLPRDSYHCYHDLVFWASATSVTRSLA